MDKVGGANLEFLLDSWGFVGTVHIGICDTEYCEVAAINSGRFAPSSSQSGMLWDDAPVQSASSSGPSGGKGRSGKSKFSIVQLGL